MSQFGFLKPEWPSIHESATRTEALVLTDPRASAIYARRTLELVVNWLYTYDKRLKSPYQDNLSALIHEPSFAKATGPAIFYKANFLKTTGNRAAHEDKPIAEAEARTAAQELFHIAFWLVRTYARGAKPDDSLTFNPALLPKPLGPVVRATLEQLRRRDEELRKRDTKLAEILAAGQQADAEHRELREQYARLLAQSTARPDTHDYGEAATRDHFIDLLLREAGWDPAAPNTAEYPVTGMPNASGEGFVDYVLWGDDGRPLALVEAKATRHSAQKGQHQAKLYADCLERMTGQRPVIFTTNGYQHFLWDDAAYPPRPTQGFYKKDELALLIQRRTTRRPLADIDIGNTIVDRYYQQRAIRRIAESFEQHHARRALLVMATGSGKTRTVIALADLLMRANWAKRILFLADRTALVKQAAREFVRQLPSVVTVNLLDDKQAEGRIFVSTYPTMMKLIDDIAAGRRRFGPGHFDLLVIDEAHRSVYRKYGAIFDYFDSLLVGLTATPRDEIDHNTYRLFNLEDGIPTDAYELSTAVSDGFLVPMRAMAVPTQFVREGISYAALSEEEKEAWDAAEWGEENGTPDRVDAPAINKWLFNADTVDQVLQHLMTHGQRIAGGDRLGKTIIFAKNQRHAEFIAQRFDTAYPEHRGLFAQVIHSNIDYAQILLDNFEKPDGAPHIAISVDMLDTGIDVPEIVNLVFFKLVRSSTKFWQMVGRGTRLRPDLFGPGQHKQFFNVFDFCQNLEYFSQSPGTDAGIQAASLGTRLFRTRLELIGALDGGDAAEATDADRTLRYDLAERLRSEVAAMTLANFLVRPHRKLVETYTRPEPWSAPVLDDGNRHDLAALAGLPSALPHETEEAKRFDLLMLRLQLGTLVATPDFARMQETVVALASALEEQVSIPIIRAQLALIQDIQSDAWWQDVTRGMLEHARRALRDLMHLIEKRRRMPIYTDFTDTFGPSTEIAFDRFAASDTFEKFRAKMRHFLRAHEDHVAINKLRMNRPLTPTDLAELQRMLIEEGGGTPDDLARAAAQCEGLGLFVRSLIGLDRGAAKQAFSKLLESRTLRPNQIAFLDMLIDHLTEHGAVAASRLYESPYIDQGGVEALFTPPDSDEIFGILDDVRSRAVA